MEDGIDGSLELGASEEEEEEEKVVVYCFVRVWFFHWYEVLV